MGLPTISSRDGEDQRVAGRPAHQPQHHPVLRVGDDVVLERRVDAIRRWAVLRGPLLHSHADGPQGPDRAPRERRVRARGEGLQESAAASRRGSAHLISDAFAGAQLSRCLRVRQSGAANRRPDVLAHCSDDAGAVSAGVRSASAVHGEAESVASRYSPGASMVA